MNLEKMMRAFLVAFSLVAGYVPFAPAGPFSYSQVNYPGSGNTIPTDINNAGLIVGTYQEPGNIYRGFTFDGTNYESVVYPGASFTSAWSVNDSGVISGFQTTSGITTGFIKKGSSYTPVAYPGADATLSFGINNLGHVVGEYFIYNACGTACPPSEQRGFFFDGVSYTTIDFPSAFRTVPMGINDLDQVVGWYLESSAGRGQGFFTTQVSLRPSNTQEKARRCTALTILER